MVLLLFLWLCFVVVVVLILVLVLILILILIIIITIIIIIIIFIIIIIVRSDFGSRPHDRCGQRRGPSVVQGSAKRQQKDGRAKRRRAKRGRKAQYEPIGALDLSKCSIRSMGSADLRSRRPGARVHLPKAEENRLQLSLSACVHPGPDGICFRREPWKRHEPSGPQNHVAEIQAGPCVPYDQTKFCLQCEATVQQRPDERSRLYVAHELLTSSE